MQGYCPRSELLYVPLLALLFLASLAGSARALDQYPGDTAIYGVSTATIQPNVLIILDNSGSMSQEVDSGVSFNPSSTYASTNNCDGGSPCSRDKVYQWRSVSSSWVTYINDVNSISCSTAKNRLLSNGVYNGKLRTSGACSGSSNSYATGNYINWQSTYGPRAKMDIAREVLTNLVSSTTGVRFGLMIFNYSEGAHIVGVGDSYGWNGYDAYVKDMDEIFSGSTTNQQALINTIQNVQPGTWTPLAEALFEGMRYYKGAATAFNGSYTYSTPIQYSCQKNYIILITDGMSTEDRNTVLRTICNNGDCNADGREPGTYADNGSHYLDDVAKYMYDSDILTDGVEAYTIGKQNVITHTIGFGLGGGNSAAVSLLQMTAYNGGGNNYLAESTSGLSESLRQILASIIEDNTSFVAPVVPVSPENRTFSGNRIYMGFFKPSGDAFWSGNLKKYGLDSDGNIVDKNGNPATNADGTLRDNAVSFWSTSADGGNVERGGAGALLITRSSARNVYTYTGTNNSLIHASNAFTTGNAAITSTLLGVADSADKDKLVNFVHGYDAYDDNMNGITTEKREWIMGDILHSKPLVVNYSSYSTASEGDCLTNRTVVYVGSNDGLLHAFRDCDGAEIWAFIPPDLLPNLKHLPQNVHSYYVDSSPSSYVYDADNDGNIEPANGDKVILIFGERRGGGHYYALDVTNPSEPAYAWRISSTYSPSGTHTDYSELGESWSEPSLAKVKVNVSGTDRVKVAAFIGAGYDNVAEDAEPAQTGTNGRGIYVVEVADITSGAPTFTNAGRKIWGYTHAQNNSLTRSIPSQLSVVDMDGNGYADRVYAADVGANIWRFDVGSTSTAGWTARKIFQSNPGADSSSGRKMFYRPALTLEVGYDLLFFGTGDREHPLEDDVVDRIYSVKDIGQTTPKSEADLSDATSTTTVSTASSSGWYIKLNARAGEKALAGATVMSRVAYFTTYTPSSSGENICSADNRGTARFYALQHLTAAPAYNFDTSNDTSVVVKGTTDRSKVIGTGIPSGMVTVISSTGISAIVGTGGALVTPPIDSTGSVIPTYWREVR